VLGVGAGWNKIEFDAFGIPFDRRLARFDDAFSTVRRLLAGDPVLQPPARPVPLMIGSMGPRMLELALPHVDVWNAWHAWYGNTAEGFAQLHERLGITGVERSACAYVVLDDSERRGNTEGSAPITANVAERVRELGDVGADEVIIVVSPCTQRSIRTLGETLF
jgi:alkanesulfonate monooxygenase SsuD/methylene tetrahydromethanopterin reductase-like flavin-dependent oxidoreductase (luciferase family)